MSDSNGVTPHDTPKSILLAMDTKDIILPFGEFRGQPLTRIGQLHLRRYAGKGGKWAEVCRMELQRRGTSYVDDPVQVSNHAFDSASKRILDAFITRQNQEEGIKTWLVNLAAEAIDGGELISEGRYDYQGITFQFDFRPTVPVLVTVMDRRPSKERKTIWTT